MTKIKTISNVPCTCISVLSINITTRWNYNMVRVLSSFVLNLVFMGIIQSFGMIFHDIQYHFDSNNANTSWVASINTGAMLLAGKLILYYNLLRKRLVHFGIFSQTYEISP